MIIDYIFNLARDWRNNDQLWLIKYELPVIENQCHSFAYILIFTIKPLHDFVNRTVFIALLINFQCSIKHPAR